MLLGSVHPSCWHNCLFQSAASPDSSVIKLIQNHRNPIIYTSRWRCSALGPAPHVGCVYRADPAPGGMTSPAPHDVPHSFQTRFLSMCRVQALPWEALEAELKASESPPGLILEVLKKTCLHPICRKTPPSVKYRRLFLSELIKRYERAAAEPLDELYDALAEVIGAEEEPVCYKTYFLVQYQHATSLLWSFTELIDSQGVRSVSNHTALCGSVPETGERSDWLENAVVRSYSTGQERMCVLSKKTSTSLLTLTEPEFWIRDHGNLRSDLGTSEETLVSLSPPGEETLVSLSPPGEETLVSLSPPGEETLVSLSPPGEETLVSLSPPGEETLVSLSPPGEETLVSLSPPGEETLVSLSPPGEETLVSLSPPGEETLVSLSPPGEETLVSLSPPGEETLVSLSPPGEETLPSGEPVSLEENVAVISEGTTGLVTWEAALYLSEWALENPHVFAGRTVLELGSGAGLTGVVVCRTCKPAKYVFSDCHQSVLQRLRNNVQLNGLTAQDHWNGAACVEELDWENVREEELRRIGADTVIAADVVYDPDIIGSLVKLLLKLLTCPALETHPDVYVASTVRNPGTYDCFKKELEKAGLKHGTVTQPVTHVFPYARLSSIEMIKIHR
ncbi:hypothetical protein NFI96_018184 [Prochilodus magdalenae]|nr:hypothetical protein NFI96_018184 [Prochilodus magdalenae]